MAHEFTADDSRRGDDPAVEGAPQIRDLQTYFRIFENPDLTRVYYRSRDGPITVPELRDDLGLNKSSAYNYIDELVDAGLLVELEASQGATRYVATDWTLTITIGDAGVTMGPLTALVVANKSRYPPIRRVIEEHGVEVLQECISEARVYDRGETTTRQLAADTGLSHGLAFDVLTAIADVFGFESADEPMTSADASDELVFGSAIDLSELEEGTRTENENTSEAPIGLMERERQSDEE